MKFTLQRILFLFILFVLFEFCLFAQNKQTIVTEITAVGLNNTYKNQIFSITNNLLGEKLQEITVINAIKKLYLLGFFEDIVVEKKELKNNTIELVFSFVEKPIIQSIGFEGNSRFTETKLKEILKTKVRNFVDLALIENDLSAIRELYTQEGYNLAKIIYRLEAKEKNNQNLTFQILENDKVYLTKINVTGSQFFFPLDIKRMMQSAEIDCFSWINSSGKLNKNKIDVDLAIITRAYLKNGFIDVNISKPRIKLFISKEFVNAEVSFHIKEGAQFFVGDILLKSLDKGGNLLFSKNEILDKMKLKEGAIYNLLQQNQDKVAVNNLYQDAGYAFSKVDIKRNIDRENKKVHSLFEITHEEKVYINRIDFIGNQETRDDILRRELTTYDGELFNGKKIRESQQNIARLGYFSPSTGIQLQIENQRSKNELNYKFYLEEIQTGNFAGGLSYSDTVGFGVNISIAKSNFLGTGRRIALEYNKGENNTLTSLSFTEPYFFSTRLSSTSNISVEFENKQNSNLDYDRDIQKLSQSFSYPIWKNWSANIGLSYEEIIRSNFNATSTVSTSTKTNSYSLTNGYTYNTINNPFFPSAGQSHNLQINQSGGFLGGNQNYRLVSYEYKYFQRVINNKFIFYSRLRFRKLLQIDNYLIPNSVRFSLGGSSTIRGFNYFSIRGPAGIHERDANFTTSSLSADDLEYYNNHQYGNEEILGNLELSFPLSRTGTNLRGLFFYDFGNVFAENRVYDIVNLEKDYSYLRQSYGTGIRIITPIGVFKFDYGIKKNIRGAESDSLFEFTIGTLF